MIHVGQPTLGGNALEYVLDAVSTNRLTMGPYVDRFEHAFAEYVGARHAVAVTSGTAALHLILAALGIGPGDEVIVPSLTFVATANAVSYTGARPVFVDVDHDTWTLDPEGVSAVMTPRVKAIIPVHLYGLPADMPLLVTVADAWGVPLVEDAAEALGAAIGTRRAGALGGAAAFSFYGNKTITTGEGGMVTTDDAALAERLRFLRGQAQAPTRRFWHEAVGFNYRMTDLQGAIGVSQMEMADRLVERRQQIHAAYRARLAGVRFQHIPPHMTHGAWGVCVLLPEGADRDGIMVDLLARGIETRPLFPPLHTMPMYQDHRRGTLFVTEHLAPRGLMLPTHADLTDDAIEAVCAAVGEALHGTRTG